MLQSVAIYEILNYNLITPASMNPEWFRTVSLVFNALEILNMRQPQNTADHFASCKTHGIFKDVGKLRL